MYGKPDGRFGKNFPYRGRQTFCKQYIPSEIQSNILTDIQEAATIIDFHRIIVHLLLNDSILLKEHTHISDRRKIVSDNPFSFNNKIYENDAINKTVKCTYKKLNTLERSLQRSNILVHKEKGVSSTCTDVHFVNTNKVIYDEADNVEWYIRLASQCYNEGLEWHMNYLSKCSQLQRKTKRKIRRTQNTEKFEKKKEIDSPCSESNNIHDIKEYDDDITNENSCQIRININNNVHSRVIATYSNFPKVSNANDAKSETVMNIHVNNLVQPEEQKLNNANISEIIDNLCALNISTCVSRSLLPQIILTDFSSTSSIPNPSPKSTQLLLSSQPLNEHHISNEVYNSNSISFIRYEKQQLPLPLNEKYYRTESRPP